MKFTKGNPGGPGRPRGRIVKLRENMGQLSDDGRTVAERLHEIIMDREASRKEVIDASALFFAYLVGRPEQAVSVEADMNVTASARVDMSAILAKLPVELVDRVVATLGSTTALLPSGDGDDDE